MKKIMVVDDEFNVVNFLKFRLEEAGYDVFCASDGIEAIQIMHKEKCDLAVVDVMMPYMDGFSLTKEIRSLYDIPIILLTAKGQISDKEEGFKSGADDYLVKPFEHKELIFRIEALFRRYQPEEQQQTIKLGSTVINKKSYEVKINNQTYMLPLKEFELLYFLASNAQQVFSREHLIEHIWGIEFEGDVRTVDVHVKRLRERFSKLTDDFQIKTVRGVGYMLESRR
ncbi:response regulator transcription factor [Bacillaceae bacterium W0354]